MRVSRKALASFLLITCLNVSGCWDSKDVANLAFPIAASYDVHQGNPGGMNQLNHGPLEEPNVDVTVIYPNLSANARSTITVETIPSATVGYAREKRSFTTSEFYVTGFNKVILVGEELAERGLNVPFESLYRFSEVSKNMLLAVVEGRGEDILKMNTDNTDNIALYLYNLLREQKAHGIPQVTMQQFDSNLAAGRNPIVPLIKTGGVNQAFLSGVAVFKKDRILAKLNLHQARSLAFLRGISSNGYVPFIVQDTGQAGSSLVTNKRKVNVERQGDKYIFVVQVQLDGIITEYPSDNIIGPERVKQVEDYIAAQTEQECRTIIDMMQSDWKTDCIDVSKYALAKWRRELKDKVDDEQFISNAEILVEVKVKLYNSSERR